MISGQLKSGLLKEARELFERVDSLKNVYTWTAMVRGYLKANQISEAERLFNLMTEKNVVSWNTMIGGEMQTVNSIKPNQGTFVSILAACSNIVGICEGRQIYQLISKTCYQHSTVVLRVALKLFHDFPDSHKDLVSWNGIISTYAHHSHGTEAIRLFEEMKKAGLKPDDVTYVGILSACSRSGLVDQGLNFFTELVDDNSIELREDHLACLVDLCGRAGRHNEAYNFIHRLEGKPIACALGSLLTGCNYHGNPGMAKMTAKKLLEVEPDNASTYMLLHNVYASSGKWKEDAKKQPGCSWIEVGNRSCVFVSGNKSHHQSKLIDGVLWDLYLIMKKDGFIKDNFVLESCSE
ncbi:hypothetical protein V2J09_012708 [Rumex salicifolius]